MKRTGTVLKRALNRARNVIIMLISFQFTAGVLFWQLERASQEVTFFDGQWWASVTGHTVGYGDLYPMTVAGRLMAMVFMPSMTVLWLIAAALIVASIIEEKHLFDNAEQERNEAFYLAMGKHLGFIPENATKLPDVEWWAQNTGFEADR